MLPIDPVIVTLALLVGGIIMSFVPLVPGGVVSFLAIGYYWLVTDEIGTVALFGFAVLGVLTTVFDLLGSAISARVGGASTRTTAVAAVAGVGLLFVLGPFGALLGVVGSVFLLEYRQHGNVRQGTRTAAVTAIGMLSSTAVQVLFTVLIFIGFVVLWI